VVARSNHESDLDPSRLGRPVRSLPDLDDRPIEGRSIGVLEACLAQWNVEQPSISQEADAVDEDAVGVKEIDEGAPV
jgi:hypothetical protein